MIDYKICFIFYDFIILILKCSCKIRFIILTQISIIIIKELFYLNIMERNKNKKINLFCISLLTIYWYYPHRTRTVPVL